MQQKLTTEKIRHSLIWSGQFCRYLWQRFVDQRGLQTASSLAYTTLLSLVPLLTVMFGFLGSLPVFREFSSDIQTFMFENFVPSLSYSLQEYLLEFSNKARQLTFTGTLVLIVIALMLMATIDNALNKVWHVKTRRNPLARFLVYWAVLSLGPLLVGLGLASTSYLLSLPALDSVYTTFGFKARLLQLAPFVTTSIAFTLLYILVPNCFVYKRFALIGGIIAAFLFEMAKFGFGVYVRAMPSYEAIYGAIAVIPIFLLWIYLSWVILILGAHITYSLSNFDLIDFKSRQSENWDFTSVYRIIGELWLAQKTGDGRTLPELKQAGIRLSQYRISEILDILQKNKWVHRSSGGAFRISRDMDELSVNDLHAILPCKLFRKPFLKTDDVWEASLQGVFEKYHASTDAALTMPLSELLNKVKTDDRQ